ncbi:5-(carboxyamino)imidazole ribonucleotide synthase [Rhodocyclus tenuis]|uniref:5-(carboxyamino)imidazole ribonucleotide synthase n=1 Tax=Rhodocyclus tenuis TaxID=1066 RepID=UPI0019031259|nr:5-(carboxyamino)imidazole ribonucleotide synthase [Rhodocyclus tenuis]MBK1679799.1 5-(carboxyamino)imidazole ribonucleotide synthase [Rhodocyclus tenuis]
MILPPATLGLLGGGQLGRFFVNAAHELGYRVVVLDPDPDSPAGRIADQHLAAAYDDPAALDHMAATCAAISTEFENVPAGSLAWLARSLPVRPGAEAVSICQNRCAEKAFLRRFGLPLAPYAEIRCAEDVQLADADLFPGILKVARFGYDGKGQVVVDNRAQAREAFVRFGFEPCVLEKKLELERELSVVLARDENGEVRCFAAAENLHRRGILDVSFVPHARAGEAAAAERLAVELAQRMDYVGVLAVEFFVVGKRIYINEMAPRPHNSGHYTLDACATSQFEQQVRALCGLPLGDPRRHSAAVMVNLLGDLWYGDGEEAAREPDWRKLLAVPNLKLHLYGKPDARPGRKMGHFTVLGSEAATAVETALAVHQSIGSGDETRLARAESR